MGFNMSLLKELDHFHCLIQRKAWKMEVTDRQTDRQLFKINTYLCTCKNSDIYSTFFAIHSKDLCIGKESVCACASLGG